VLTQIIGMSVSVINNYLRFGEPMKAGKRKRNGPGRPRTTGTGKLVGVRVQKPLAARIEQWRKSKGGDLSEPSAMRQLIDLGLKSEGY
jgi:hypothetical protein